MSTWPRALQLGPVAWPRSSQPTHLHPLLWRWEPCQGLPRQPTMWPGSGSRAGGLWNNWDRQRKAGKGLLCVGVVGRPGALSQVPIFSIPLDSSCLNSLLLLRTSELAMGPPCSYDSNSSFVAYCSPFGCSLFLPSGLGAPQCQGPAVVTVCSTSRQDTHFGKMPWAGQRGLLPQLCCPFSYVVC